MRKIIPNIYLYCDGWCEKCGYSSVCEVNEFHDNRNNLTIHDKNNLQFWSDFMKSLTEIKNAIISIGEKEDVDWNNYDGIQRRTRHDLFQGKKVVGDLLPAGRLYEDFVDDWIDAMGENGKIVVDNNVSPPEFKVSKKYNSFENIDNINNSISILIYYQLKIYLKLSRTIYTSSKEKDNDNSDLPSSNGTAKTLIEMLERSLVSWHNIYDAFGDDASGIEKKAMIHLIKLIKNIERDFPDARGYMRPGFDGL